MKNILEGHPITILLSNYGEEQIFNRLKSLKEIYESGINWQIFDMLVSNARNRSTSFDKNSFTIEEWLAHFQREVPIVVLSREQLIMLWEYLTLHHANVLQQQDKKYILRNSPTGENFRLEYLILQTLGM